MSHRKVIRYHPWMRELHAYNGCRRCRFRLWLLAQLTHYDL